MTDYLQGLLEPDIPHVETEQDSNLVRGLKSGWASTKAAVPGLVAMGAKALGSDKVAEWASEKALDLLEEAGKYRPDTTFEELIEDPSVGGFIDQVLFQLGNVAPTMLMGLGAGGVGAKVGTSIVKRGVQKKLKDEILKRAALRGAQTGVVSSTAGLESSLNFLEDVQRHGIEQAQPLPAVATGTAAGFVELLGGQMRIFNKLLGPKATKVIVDVAEGGKLQTAKRMAKEGILQSGGEAFQEMTQEELSILNEFFTATPEDEHDHWSKENWLRRAESAFAGAVVGAPTGAVTGAFTKQETPTKKISDDIKEQENIVKVNGTFSDEADAKNKEIIEELVGNEKYSEPLKTDLQKTIDKAVGFRTEKEKKDIAKESKKIKLQMEAESKFAQTKLAGEKLKEQLRKEQKEAREKPSPLPKEQQRAGKPKQPKTFRQPISEKEVEAEIGRKIVRVEDKERPLYQQTPQERARATRGADQGKLPAIGWVEAERRLKEAESQGIKLTQKEKDYYNKIIDEHKQQKPMAYTPEDVEFIRNGEPWAMYATPEEQAKSEKPKVGETKEEVTPKKVAEVEVPEETAKKELPKIGDPITVMGTKSILAKHEEEGGVRYELFNASKLKDKRGYIRVYDVDSGEVVTLKKYKTYDQAEKEYIKTLNTVKGSETWQKKQKLDKSKEEEGRKPSVPVTKESASAEKKATKQVEIVNAIDKGVKPKQSLFDKIMQTETGKAKPVQDDVVTFTVNYKDGKWEREGEKPDVIEDDVVTYTYKYKNGRWSKTEEKSVEPSDVDDVNTITVEYKDGKWERVKEQLPKTTTDRKKLWSNVVDSVNNQKGEAVILSDLVNYGRTVFDSGATKFKDFRTKLKQDLKEVWDKVKRHVRKIYNYVRQGLQPVFNEKGMVEAWHGSPHKFTKFTTSKIGTGEGAQAFGWGLYFTDKKAIAEHYAKSLGGRNQYYRIGNKKYTSDIIQEIDPIVGYWLDEFSDKSKIKNQKDRDDILDSDGFHRDFKNIIDHASWQMDITDKKDFDYQYWRDSYEIHKEIYDGIVSSNGKVDFVAHDKHLYKVSLHKGKDPSEYTWLDWYKKVKPKTIQGIIDNLNLKPENTPQYQELKRRFGQKEADSSKAIINKRLRDTVAKLVDLKEQASDKYGRTIGGKELYYEMENVLRSRKFTSLAMLKGGIDGIRYPTESLSGRGTESDKYNYVVFDENAITIEEHNGKIIDVLKNQGGSTTLFTDLVSTGMHVWDQGKTTLPKFRSQFRTYFKEVWDQVRDLVKKVYDQVKKIIANERGAIDITVGKDVAPKVATKEVPKKAEKQEVIPIEEHLTNWEKVKTVIKSKPLSRKGRPDYSWWELFLGTPLNIVQKTPATKELWNAAQEKQDQFHEGIFQMENIEGRNGGRVNVIDLFKKLSKASKEQFNRVGGYLVDTDRTGKGFYLQKAKEGQWHINDPKGTIVGTYKTELKAQEEMFEKERTYLIDKKGFTEQQADAVFYFRQSTLKGFQQLIGNLKELEQKYKDAKKDPPTFTFKNDEGEQQIDLKAAIARMGDLRGTYFPRIRQPGKYFMTAYKEGEYNILETFGGVVFPKKKMDLRAAELRKKGYTVFTQKTERVGEDVFALSGDLVRTQQLVNEALRQVDKEFTPEAKEQHLDAIFATALSEQLANVIRRRGTRLHMTKRAKDLYIGYEENPEIALAKYIRSLSAGEAKREMTMRMMKAMMGISLSFDEYKDKINPDATRAEYKEYVDRMKIVQPLQPRIFRWATKYIQENTRNAETADEIIGTFKGLGVAKYLSTRVFAAPFVNLTALPTSTIATMKGAGIPYLQTWKYLNKGLKKYGKYRLGRKMPEIDKWVFDEIVKRGWDNPQFTAESMTTLRSQMGRGWDKALDVAMFTFTESEKMNRAATIAGTYWGLRAQTKGKIDKATRNKLLEKAKEVSDRSHSVYNKGNYPYLALGTNPAAYVAKSFYVFRNFAHNYLQNMYRLGFKEKDKVALAHMVLAPAIIAGAGASVMAPMISQLLKAFGMDDPEEDMYLNVGKYFGPTAESFARFGITGLGGYGFSVKGSLAIGIGDIPTNMKELLGAPASVVQDFYYAGKFIKGGQVMRGFEKALPTGIGNVLRGYRESTEGFTTWRGAPKFYGTEQIKLSPFEGFMRTLSLNPARTAEITEKQYKEYKIESKYGKLKSEIYAKIYHFYSTPPQRRSKARWARIMEEIEAFNILAKKRGISPITKKSIKTNIRRNFRPSKKERNR